MTGPMTALMTYCRSILLRACDNAQRLKDSHQALGFKIGYLSYILTFFVCVKICRIQPVCRALPMELSPKIRNICFAETCRGEAVETSQRSELPLRKPPPAISSATKRSTYLGVENFSFSLLNFSPYRAMYPHFRRLTWIVICVL